MEPLDLSLTAEVQCRFGSPNGLKTALELSKDKGVSQTCDPDGKCEGAAG